jgi:hypothetical protein
LRGRANCAPSNTERSRQGYCCAAYQLSMHGYL